MKNENLTVTSQLELSEIIYQCLKQLKAKGYISEEILKTDDFEQRKAQFKCFETLIATGLYHIMNDNEIKTDFNYLGNNNNIQLNLNTFKLSELLREGNR